jgi:hypothetical protein
MRADVLDAIGEVIEALTLYSDRQDREVELIIRADGTAGLMGAEAFTVAGEPATGFDEIASFDSFAELWAELTGDVVAVQAEADDLAEVED